MTPEEIALSIMPAEQILLPEDAADYRRSIADAILAAQPVQSVNLTSGGEQFSLSLARHYPGITFWTRGERSGAYEADPSIFDFSGFPLI